VSSASNINCEHRDKDSNSKLRCLNRYRCRFKTCGSKALFFLGFTPDDGSFLNRVLVAISFLPNKEGPILTVRRIPRPLMKNKAPAPCSRLWHNPDLAQIGDRASPDFFTSWPIRSAKVHSEHIGDVQLSWVNALVAESTLGMVTANTPPHVLSFRKRLWKERTPNVQHYSAVHSWSYGVHPFLLNFSRVPAVYLASGGFAHLGVCGVTPFQ
jgi:hypothetical protein